MTRHPQSDLDPGPPAIQDIFEAGIEISSAGNTFRLFAALVATAVGAAFPFVAIPGLAQTQPTGLATSLIMLAAGPFALIAGGLIAGAGRALMLKLSARSWQPEPFPGRAFLRSALIVWCLMVGLTTWAAIGNGSLSLELLAALVVCNPVALCGLTFVPFTGARRVVGPQPSTFRITHAIGWWRPLVIWWIHVALAFLVVIWVPLFGSGWTVWLVLTVVPLIAIPPWVASMAWIAAGSAGPALARAESAPQT